MIAKHKLAVVMAALVVLAPACVGSGGANARTILVDFSHDEFASFFLFNYPKQIAVTQGTKLVFRQTWTGEAHTVTGGSLVDETLGSATNWISFFEAYEGMIAAGVPVPNPEDPPDIAVSDALNTIEEADQTELRDKLLGAYDGLVEKGSDLPPRDNPGDMRFTEMLEIIDRESTEAIEGLPFAFGETEELTITQNAGQPCYRKDGGPPENPDDHCDSDEQTKPAFDGSYSYFNSGIIPYEGAQGNTFEVQLSDDIDPGTYWFYCAVHGPLQATQVEVRQRGGKVPDQSEVNRQAREEIDALADPLLELYEDAVDDNRIEVSAGEEPQEVEGPFAGLIDPGISTSAMINEFVPRNMQVDAGEPITWKMMGAPHTISFGVPRYFPPVQFLEDGTIRANPRLSPPAGGAKRVPSEINTTPGEEAEPGPPPSIDGGTYDGEGFWSSGLIGAQPYLEYTMRISEPGTYNYACLIHPPMVGKIEVT